MSTTNGQNGHKNGEYKYLGKDRPIIEGLEKVTGYARYAADVKLPNLAYARLVLSPHAHAKIIEIDKSEAESMPGVIAVLTAEDLMTRDRVITSRNSALLAKDRVLWTGQPVAIVIADSDALASDAVDMVFVDYDPLPAVVDLEEAIKLGTPQVWPNGLPKEGEDMSSLHADVQAGDLESEDEGFNNVSTENHFGWGDVDQGFAESDLIVERRFKTGTVHQAYLEPHAVVAEPKPLGRGVTLYTSTQGQFDVRNEVARILGMPVNNVTIVPMTVGGGFGAKYGIFESLVGAAAIAIDQPVRLFLSRSEDFLTTTPAPMTIIELKIGAKNDGTVTAMQGRMFVDNGIFSFNHGGIISMLIGGTYKWEHMKLDAYEVHTNKPQAGAYRAPGAPQATFAVESLMDEIARKLDIDPLELRMKNAIDGGDKMGVGRPWPQNLGLKQCIARMQEHPAWTERKPGEGVGIAVGAWPCFIGTAEAICRVDSDGRVRINLGVVDISGTRSAFVLVAAETLGVSPDMIDFIQDDTNGAYGPGSGGSKVTYTVAGAVRDAAADVRQQLLEMASDEFEAAAEDIEIVDGFAQVVGNPDQQIPIGTLAAKARSQIGGRGPIVGEAKSAPPEAGPGFVVHLVKVKVDEESGEIKLLDSVMVQDVGFALNPLVMLGQLHGGAVQSMSMAMGEAMIYNEDGQLLTGSFMDYDMPRFDTTPNLETIYLEIPSPHGPFGARGIGEPPIAAGAAAIANAIADATGVLVEELPIKKETLWQAMQQS